MGFSTFFRTKNTCKPTQIKGLQVFITEGQIAFTGTIYLVVVLRLWPQDIVVTYSVSAFTLDTN